MPSPPCGSQGRGFRDTCHGGHRPRETHTRGRCMLLAPSPLGIGLYKRGSMRQRHPVWSQPNAVGTLASQTLSAILLKGFGKSGLAHGGGPRRNDSWHEACFVLAEIVAVQRRPSPLICFLDRADAQLGSARDGRPARRPPCNPRYIGSTSGLWWPRVQKKPRRAHPRRRRWLRPCHRLDGARPRWRLDRPRVGLVDHGRGRAQHTRRCAGSGPLPYRSGSRGHARTSTA